MLSPDGGVLYGDTQEQLIKVMLTGDFLKDSLIGISHGADMSIDWDRVIAKQLELGQTVPDKTMLKYNAYRVEQALTEREPLPEDIKLTEVNLEQFDMSHGWDKLLPLLLANDYVVDFNLAEKCEA